MLGARLDHVDHVAASRSMSVRSRQDGFVLDIVIYKGKLPTFNESQWLLAVSAKPVAECRGGVSCLN